MNKKLKTFKFIFADWFAALLAWASFFVYRKLIIEHLPFNQDIFLKDPKFFYGIVFIPLGWLAIYGMVGTYANVYRKSRLRELGQTLYLSVIGVLIIFFSLLLDDVVVAASASSACARRVVATAGSIRGGRSARPGRTGRCASAR